MKRRNLDRFDGCNCNRIRNRFCFNHAHALEQILEDRRNYLAVAVFFLENVVVAFLPHQLDGVIRLRPFAVVGFRFQPLNGFAAEAEDPLAERLVGVERHLRSALRQPENGVGDEVVVAAEVRDVAEALAGSSTKLRERVEEVPEGGAVGDGVVDGAADEQAVGELGDLNGHDRRGVSAVADLPVEGEEFLEGFRDVGGG